MTYFGNLCQIKPEDTIYSGTDITAYHMSRQKITPTGWFTVGVIDLALF